MSDAHRREKNPELVRQALIDSAGRLAVEQGLAAVSVNAVAEAAGVTKGGLFHHFANKQALVEAVCAEQLAAFDATIDALIDTDETAHGRFTRAYVEATFVDDGESTRKWAAIWISSVTDPDLRGVWGRWLASRLERHRVTDADPQLEVARYAADGVWLADLTGDSPSNRSERQALKERLLRLVPASGSSNQGN